MGFHINFEKISIDSYMAMLKKSDLIPSMVPLLDGIDVKFRKIKARGITTLADVFVILKTKTKTLAFAHASGIEEEYLILLSREVRSRKKKPCKIKDFPGIGTDTIRKLEKKGFKDALQLFTHVLTPGKRKAFARELEIPEGEILRLARLIDLSRIRWVNHTFAHVLLESGFGCVEAIAQADPENLYETVKRTNKKENLFRGQIGENDMRRLVEEAQILPIDMTW